jgi:membrane protease YdiL (CAAX protease family)
MLFRSLLLGGLQPIAPAALLLVLSSVLFGVLHLPQGAWGIAGAALAGALLGALFLVSGSILAPAAAHYVTNMAQIVQAKRDREREGESQEPALDG